VAPEVPAIGPCEGFDAIGPLRHMASAGTKGWGAAFECLQTLRLQVRQMGDPPLETASQVDVASPNHGNRHMLEVSDRVAPRLPDKLERDDLT
jgi:hypothetical protein